jgi:hypothetical protein
MNDPLPLIPNPLPALVECPTFSTLEASFTGVKSGGRWVDRGTCEQEWIGLDGTIDGSLVSVNVDLPVSSTIMQSEKLRTGDRK